MPERDTTPRSRLTWLLLPLVVVGFAAIWALVSLVTGRQCSWMAVIGALDLLWIAGLPRRLSPAARGAVAAIGTVVIVLLANWSIIATHVGGALGFSPVDSIRKLGVEHAWTMAGLANHWQDGVWLVVALVVAAGWPLFSARRREPSAH